MIGTTKYNRGEPVYLHPDGYSIHFNAKDSELIVLDEAAEDFLIVPIGPKGLIELGLNLIGIGFRDTIHTDVEKHHGIGVPVAKAQQPRPQNGSGFFISSPVAGDTVSFLADRVGHSQECVGSFARYANPHGLPPSIGVEGAGLEPVAKEPLMANSVHTGITPTTSTLSSSIYGVDPAELHAASFNSLHRALRELNSDDTDYTSALQKAEAAVACLWSLATAQKKGGVQ